MNLFDLTGKVALVTGASRGIGEAIARAYVAAGADVVISSRRAENIEPVAESINTDFPGKALAVVAHAGQTESAESLVQQAVERFGRLDIAVNNAATNPHFGQMLASEESHWDKILDVNVKGYFFVCQAAAKQMIKQESGGKLINVASIAGIEPGPMMGIYSVSKAAVIMMTKSLGMELGSDNIQVNAIAPGFIKTKFSSALWTNEKLSNELIADTPAGRIAGPDELTGIALYLASNASGYSTGAVHVVDGGYILG